MSSETLLADFLERDEAAAELKVCRRTLDRWRQLGEGPPVTKLGRRVLYSRRSLLAWLREGEHCGAKDAGHAASRARACAAPSN